MADEIRILRPQDVAGNDDAKLRAQAMEAERRRAAAASAAIKGGGKFAERVPIDPRGNARFERPPQQQVVEEAPAREAPGDPVFAASGQAANDALNFARAADQRVVLQRRNPMHEPVKRHIGETAGAQTQILQGAEAERAAQVNAATQAAEFMANEARRQNDAIVDARAAEFERQQMLDEGVQALREVNKNVAEATARFSETKGVDPGRHWASRTAGQKFVAVLGGIARGLLKMDPMAHLQAAIDNDIAAQEANIGLRKTALDEAQEGVGRAANVYETLRLNVGDKRTADMMMEQARLGQAEQQFKALLAEHGLNQLTAEQDRFLGEIAQRRADLGLMIEQRTAANPRMITSVRKARGAAERKVLGQLAGESAAASRDLQAQGFKQQGDERMEGIKGQAEIEKERAKGQGVDTKATMAYAKEAAAAEGMIRQIDKILEREDIPGYGPVGRTVDTPFIRHLAGDETLTLEKEADAVVEQLGRLQSQGVISPTEEVRFREMIFSGTMKGGEDALRRNLKVVRDMAATKLQTLKKGLAPQDLDYVERGEPGKFKAEPSKDVRLPSVVDVDE